MITSALRSNTANVNPWKLPSANASLLKKHSKPPTLRMIPFRNVTQSEIRKRLFRVVNDPASDYHEIRWLIKSLEMLKT